MTKLVEMAKKEIILILLFACSLASADFFGLEYLIGERKERNSKDAEDSSSEDSGEAKETDRSNEVEPEKAGASDTYWDCSDSSLNVRRCVLRGNVTQPETLVIFKQEKGHRGIPTNPPEGVISDYSSIKPEGPLDEIMDKIKKTFKSVFDFIKKHSILNL